MTKISELLAKGFSFSVEMWPPRNEQSEQRLEVALGEIKALRPTFVSITYGAGGSTRERTHELVTRLECQRPPEPMAHLTCAAHSRQDLVAIIRRYLEAGVENILALHGDPPLDVGDGLVEGELRHAIDLVELLRQEGEICVAVAAHPEGHPLAPDLATDRRHLAEKLRLADFAITQFFFKVEDYLRLVDDVQALGVYKPILPGIMPISNVRSLARMAAMSGTQVPPFIYEKMEAAGQDSDEVRKVGVEIATSQCESLLAAGVPGLHFFTMNQASATRDIYVNLDLSSRMS